MTTQRKPLSPREIKAVGAVVKAELNGKSHNVAAKEVFPNQTPGAAAVSMSRTLKKANVQDALAAALEAHGITLNSAIKPIGDGLKATRTVIVRDKGATNTDESNNSAFADEVPDHAIRLKASGMALGLMGVGKQSGDVTINFVSQSADQRQVYDL